MRVKSAKKFGKVTHSMPRKPLRKVKLHRHFKVSAEYTKWVV